MMLTAMMIMAMMCATTTVSAQEKQCDKNKKECCEKKKQECQNKAKECCEKKEKASCGKNCQKCTECKETCHKTDCKDCKHQGQCKKNCKK